MKFLLIVFVLGTTTCQQSSTRLSVLIDLNQKAVAEIITVFEDAKHNVIKELATLSDGARIIINLAGELKSKISTEVFADRFGATVAQLTKAAEQLRSTNPAATALILQELAVTAKRGADTFEQCYNKELAGDLLQIINSVPQTTASLVQADIAFKTQVVFCGTEVIVRTGTAQKCINNTLAAVPIPSINTTGLQTAQSMNKLVNCVDKGVQSIKQYGDNILQKIKNVITSNMQNLIPSQFEGNFSTSAAFPIVSRLLPFPTLVANSLAEAKAAITAGKNIQIQATASKVINIDTAKEYLKPQLQLLSEFISQNEGTSTSQDVSCYLAAKAYQQASIQTKATNLVNCIVNSGQVSTAYAFNTAEAAIKDIESKENALLSAVECSKDVRNIFDPVRYDRCTESAQKDVSTKLGTLKWQVNSIAAEASEVLTTVARCKCQVETELKREAKAEAYKLAYCIMVNSQIRVDLPQGSCVINSCSV